MKIIHTSEAVRDIKPEGNVAHYFLFDDYEIIQTDQLLHTEQVWHHHETIAETLYVVKGELTVLWRNEDGEMSAVLRAGDVVEVERSVHTFKNDTDRVVRLLAVKRIPVEGNFREVFKTDKVLD